MRQALAAIRVRRSGRRRAAGMLVGSMAAAGGGARRDTAPAPGATIAWSNGSRPDGETQHAPGAARDGTITTMEEQKEAEMTFHSAAGPGRGPVLDQLARQFATLPAAAADSILDAHIEEAVRQWRLDDATHWQKIKYKARWIRGLARRAQAEQEEQG